MMGNNVNNEILSGKFKLSLEWFKMSYRLVNIGLKDQSDESVSLFNGER